MVRRSAADYGRLCSEHDADRPCRFGAAGEDGVNQICIAGVVQGLAEGLHFAKRADLDVEKVIRGDFQRRGAKLADGKSLETMNEGRFGFGFAVDWMRKDLGLVLDGS